MHSDPEAQNSSPLPLGPESVVACGCCWYWEGQEVHQLGLHLHQGHLELQELQLVGQHLGQT